MTHIIEQLKKDLNAVVEEVKHELAGIRTGRANTILVENIQVENYGQKMPLKHLGNITVQPPKTIVVQAWDHSAVPAIVKALEGSGLGLTPNAEGNVIRVNLPALTEERRKELVKYAGKLTEERKIRVRHLRDEARKAADELPAEDDRFRAKDKIQEAVDEANKEIGELLETKVKEIEE